MTTSPFTWTRLEKAAYDNGFDIEGPRFDEWRTFTSSHTCLQIWLGTIGDALYIVAMSRWEVFEELDGLGIPWKNPLPLGAAAARSTGDQSSLHRLLRRAFQLSRALPDEPLQRFAQETSTMPSTTEAERLIVQRVGQDMFRRGLIDYWEGRCPLSGLAVVELLRASHIKPWVDCETDKERLDVFNGLLLAPHLDAAFDRGFMTLDDEGCVVLSASLDAGARTALGLDGSLRQVALTGAHCAYLHWHRRRVFRGTAIPARSQAAARDLD